MASNAHRTLDVNWFKIAVRNIQLKTNNPNNAILIARSKWFLFISQSGSLRPNRMKTKSNRTKANENSNRKRIGMTVVRIVVFVFEYLWVINKWMVLLLFRFALAAEWKTEWKSKVQMKWPKEEVSGVRNGKPFHCGVETTLMMTTATVAVTRRQLNIVHTHSAIWPPSWLNECAHLLYGKSTFFYFIVCSVFFISRLFLIVAVLFIHFFAAAITVAVTAAVQTMLLRI